MVETIVNVDVSDGIVVAIPISVSFTPSLCSLLSVFAIEAAVDNKEAGCVVIGISSSLPAGRVGRFSSLDSAKQV